MDFVNTLRERWWRRVECLVTTGDLSEWLTRAGLLPEAAVASSRDLASARRLREAIDACVVTSLEGLAPPGDAVAEIDRSLRHLRGRPSLHIHGERALLCEELPADPVKRALGRVALDAARMLGTDARHGIRICASETCSARFYDRSPGGRRIWCSMDGGCGNREKVRRYRGRQQRPNGDPRWATAS